MAPVLLLSLSCTGARLYYVHSEVPKLEGKWAVGPGPWPAVPAVISDGSSVPDALVLSALKALMALPGAADSCDAWGQPRPDAAEYCIATYRTPRDWRVTWPIRNLVDAASACRPPFGGVEDADFGRDLPVFGYAHNHTCGLFASSTDLMRFPAARAPTGAWVVVGYATAPSGGLARDSQGELIPAWHWLATGHATEPRFYKWNPAGEVFKWSENGGRWEFQAICKPESSTLLEADRALAPNCTPALTDWY